MLAPSRLGEIEGRERLHRQLRWLVGLRLLVVTSIALPYFFYQATVPEGDPEGANARFVYLIAGLTYGASLIHLIFLWLLKDTPRLQAYVQFVGDLLLVSILVYRFGGIISPFSIFYFVIIIVASAMLLARAGVFVGLVAWGLYALTIVAPYAGWLPWPGLPPLDVSVWQIGTKLGLHLLGFMAVALLSSRLARQVTRTERELAAQRADFAALQVFHRDIIESVPSGLITCNLAGRVTSVNRAALEILGNTDDETIVGSPITEIGLFSENEWSEIRRSSQADARNRHEVDLRIGDSTRTLGFSLSSLRRADGRPAGYIVIFQDLSDWRRLQEEMRIKEKLAAVGELAAGLAHEIGNPLAAVSGSVQILQSSTDEDDSKRTLLDIISKESQRLDRTIKGFLQFARPTERASRRFDIAAVLRNAFELLRNSPEVRPDHRVELRLDPEEATLVADPDQISQIFWNLARNALRAMPGGGTLLVEGSMEGQPGAQRIYRLRFSDTGTGMSETERARLFQPFRSFFDHGTGIGMAIVYRIVEEHGGRIEVHSEEGSGTVITIEIPVVDSPRKLAAPTEPA